MVFPLLSNDTALHGTGHMENAIVCALGVVVVTAPHTSCVLCHLILESSPMCLLAYWLVLCE